MNRYGFKATFNATFPHKGGRPHGWVTPWHFGLDQGPIVMMIENYRTGFLWRLMRQSPYIVAGLQQAGFRNGWLCGDSVAKSPCGKIRVASRQNAEAAARNWPAARPLPG